MSDQTTFQINLSDELTANELKCFRLAAEKEGRSMKEHFLAVHLNVPPLNKSDENTKKEEAA